MKKVILLATTMLALQGCIFVVGAAAGGAAVSAVYDHRKLSQINQDNRLNNRIIDQINTIPDLHDRAHVSVTTFNSVVLLSGEALTPELSQQIENEAHKVEGINKIYNELAIKGPSSSLTKASDSWITAKIKTKMLAMKGLQSGSIKVVTENGTVYLMGMVNKDQAENTVDIARQVAGVQRVIKIFQYTEK